MLHLGRVLVGYDFDQAADSALEEVGEVARHLGAELHLVHALAGLRREDPAFAARAGYAARRLEVVRAGLEGRGLEASPRLLVAGGDPAQVILDAAAELLPDVLALGTGRRTSLDRTLLGETADHVLRRSPWPVWLVRPGRPQTRLRTILCACDGAPRHEALGLAATLAQALAAELTLLTVVPPLHQGGATWASQALLHELAPGLGASQHLTRHGEATALITETATRTGAQLVVLGSSFRQNAGSLFGASIAERLLRVLPCSLLAVRAPARVLAPA